jgi:hypothetical protein
MSGRRPLLAHESSDLSESSSAAAATPALPSLGYDARPLGELSFYNDTDISPPASPIAASSSRFREENVDDIAGTDVGVGHDAPPFPHTRRVSSGLGIATGAQSRSATTSPSPYLPSRDFSRRSLNRVPVGFRSPSHAKSPSIGSEPNTGNPLLGGFPRDGSATSTPDLKKERVAFSPREEVIDEYEAYRGGGIYGATSADAGQNNDYQHYIHENDTERLRRINRMSASGRSAYEGQWTQSEYTISHFS